MALLALVTVTCTPEMTAPLESLMVPVMEARSDWARSSPAVSNNTEKTLTPNFMRTPKELLKGRRVEAFQRAPRPSKRHEQRKRISADLHFGQNRRLYCVFDSPHQSL
jgi:hypothetical protein